MQSVFSFCSLPVNFLLNFFAEDFHRVRGLEAQLHDVASDGVYLDD